MVVPAVTISTFMRNIIKQINNSIRKQIVKKNSLKKNFLFFSMKNVKNKVPIKIEITPKLRKRFLKLPDDQIKKGEMILSLE